MLFKEFTLTPDDTTTSQFGNVTMLTGSSIQISDGKWYMIGNSHHEPIDMAIQTTTFAGDHCEINDFNITYDAYHTSSEGDGAILLQAGDEYISFMFDFDGGVIIDGADIFVGGSAIYPPCGTSYMPKIPYNSTSLATLFDDSTDTNDEHSTSTFLYHGL